MSLKYIPLRGDSGMAGLVLGTDLVAVFDHIQIIGMMDSGFQPMGLQVGNPFFTTAASRAFVYR
jgi:hypothetical protein